MLHNGFDSEVKFILNGKVKAVQPVVVHINPSPSIQQARDQCNMTMSCGYVQSCVSLAVA